MLSKVSLVVPTYNRPQFVHRFLSYHAKSDGLQIILGDGSDAEHLAENKKVIAAFSGTGLDIVHYTPELPSFVKPGLEGGYGYAERQVNGARLSSRPYVNICADDDFVSPEFLAEATVFMEANPDYSAATGYVCGVELDTAGAAGRVSALSLPPLRSTGRAEPQAADRIGRYERDTNTCLEFAFFRRDTFDAIGTTLLDVALKAQDPTDQTPPKTTTFTLLYLYDLIPDHLALALGKVHWLPRLQLARHMHDANWGGQVVRRQYKVNFGDSFIAPQWPGLVSIYLDAVAAALTRSEGLDYATARRIAEGGLAIRAGQRLSHVGQQRLEESDAYQRGSRPSLGGLRGRLQAFPPARAMVRAARGAISQARSTRLTDVPADVAAMKHFLEDYR